MPVRFYLYPVPNKKGECPIRVSISIGSSRYMTGIGYNCATDAWEDGLGDCSTLNVPPISLSNVPGISE